MGRNKGTRPQSETKSGHGKSRMLDFPHPFGLGFQTITATKCHHRGVFVAENLLRDVSPSREA
jgi:hypothetical protein